MYVFSISLASVSWKVDDITAQYWGKIQTNKLIVTSITEYCDVYARVAMEKCNCVNYFLLLVESKNS